MSQFPNPGEQSQPSFLMPLPGSLLSELKQSILFVCDPFGFSVMIEDEWAYAQCHYATCEDRQIYRRATRPLVGRHEPQQYGSRRCDRPYSAYQRQGWRPLRTR